MEHINVIRDKAAKLLTLQEEILKREHADGNAALTEEERTEMDRIEADLAPLMAEIDKDEAAKKVRASQDRLGTTTEPIHVDGRSSDETEARDKAYAEAFTAYLRWGADKLRPEQRQTLAGNWVSDDGTIPLEGRALIDTPQTVTTTGGGYLIPQGFQAELMEALKAYGGTRRVARILSTPSGNNIPWPTVDDTGNTGELIAVNTIVTNQAVAYGVKTLGAFKYSSKLILVPLELAQDSLFPIDSHLRGIMATRIGRITNTHFTVGTDSGQPQGVVVAAYSAVTSEAATGVSSNDLINLEHSVDPAYRDDPSCGFMFNDATLKTIKKLKDADGRPLWKAGLSEPGLSGGQPSDIDGFPYTINQDMASATTGLKAVLFGAFSHYIVRDVMEITVLRLVERFAEYGQVGYLAFSRHDGRGVNGETNNGAIRYLLQA